MLKKITRQKWFFHFLTLSGVLILLVTGFLLVKYLKDRNQEYYTIGVVYSSTETIPKELETTKFLVGKKLESINHKGGINRRPVKVIYIDDKGDLKALYRMVDKVSDDENLIGLVGCRGANRAKAIGPIVTRKKIPVLSLYVYTDLVRMFPTIYSTNVGLDEYELILKQFFFTNHVRLGFLGQKGLPVASEYTKKQLDRMVGENSNLEFPVHRIYPLNYDFESADFKSFTDSLKKHADLLFVDINFKNWNSLLAVLEREHVKMPIFTGTADISRFDPSIPGYKSAELCYINSIGIPGTQNTKLYEHLIPYSKQLDLSAQNSYLLSESARIADEIGLLAEASGQFPISPGKNIREHINAGLRQYINGEQIYRGWLKDWYFKPDHSYGNYILLAWKPANTITPILWPFQNLRSNNISQVGQVLFSSINPVKFFRVDDNAGTFSAIFYLEVNTPTPFTLDKIDFANAVRNEGNNEPLIEAKLIRSIKSEVGYKFYNNLFKISGKFYFEPELRRYPLDRQKFPIIVQSGKANELLLIQPSVKSMQDTTFEAEGWKYENQYVGHSQDFITSNEYSTGLQKNIPYYKFSFVYTMKRTHIDFFLKTLVPLIAILIITYFSVYIPPREFEAQAGIQVTGLLSSIALYFSTFKPEVGYTTLSDNIFIFTYIMITTLIGTSILLYVIHPQKNTLSRAMRIYQRIIFPLLAFGFLIYIRSF